MVHRDPLRKIDKHGWVALDPLARARFVPDLTGIKVNSGQWRGVAQMH